MNCAFACLKSHIYLSAFEDAYLLLYFDMKLYIECLLVWACILYAFYIEIANIYIWMIQWIFIYEYLYVIWNCNHVFLVLNSEFECVCIIYILICILRISFLKSCIIIFDKVFQFLHQGLQWTLNIRIVCMNIK